MGNGERHPTIETTAVGRNADAENARDTGPPPLSTTPRLFCVAGDDVGTRFPIDLSRPMMIGRGVDVAIQLRGVEVSRRHAEIRHRGGRMAVADMSSRNGTAVNARALLAGEERVLKPGDRIELGGGTTLVLEHHDALEERAQRLHELDLVAMVTAGIVHDFKNTLMIVLANAELLRDSFATDEGGDDRTEMASDILGAARRGLESSERLLYFARRQSGAEARAQIEIGALVDEIVATVRRPLTQARITLNVECRAKGTLHGTRYELHHALLNLVLNARDAMPDGGTLTIRTRSLELKRADALRLHVREAGHHIELVVEDTGIGMDAATQARLFEPYFTTKGSGGTGLGLPSVFGVVRGHGGNVLVESAPRRGTRFRLILPIDG
ncbi:MAG TPA: hypothetical protein DCY18_05565 [Thauera sp.]|nr:hypothetical protein [Thauera sp.]